MVAKTNDGTATNKVEKKIITLSAQEFRLIAARQPKNNPKTKATTIDVPPSMAEIEKLSKIVWEIFRPVLSEIPKSPWKIFPR